VPVRQVREIWGTVCSIDVRDDVDVGAVEACFAWFGRVDDLFSTWRPDTEIMRIGRGELAPAAASSEVREVLALSDAVRDETGGAFDIAVGARPGVPPAPGRAPLDPSGIVKGWAVERAATILRDAGAGCYMINAGGDVVTRGAPAGSDGWRIGIQHPWDRDRVAAVVRARDQAVATSGRYERGDHVLDPRTGAPARGFASATVVGPDLAIADAYATAVIVLGPARGLQWIATHAGYEAMAITDNRAVLFTPNFDRYRVS
jgi:thiamine biosynthesis lipoprotein